MASRDPLENWSNRHRDELEKCVGEYVAYGEDFFVHDRDLGVVLEMARATGKRFVVTSVARPPSQLRVLPLHVRSLGGHAWLPVRAVELRGPAGSLISEMIVDSGADISVVPHEFGQKLGWATTPAEVPHDVSSLGGSVQFFPRLATISVDDHAVEAPVAWLSSPGSTELILGRAVVFDAWDITFVQAEERIDFRWRGA
jgi:hypothetical protein